MKNKNILLIILIYLGIAISLGINQNIFYANIINLIFWTTMISYNIWDIKNSYIRYNYNRKYLKGIIAISVINVIAYFYIGFIFGFSQNPYSQKLPVMLQNILLKLIPIIGVELTRSTFATRNRNNKIALILLTILLSFVEINYYMLSNEWIYIESLFKYICSNIIPIIANNILYTYLTLKGSHLIVLIYRFSCDIVYLAMPILPDIDWFVTGTMSILTSVVVYFLFEYILTTRRKDSIKKRRDNLEKISYIITLILLMSLVCFMLGVFKYEPIAILSNSMNPTYTRGDVVIFKKPKELKNIPINTIIIYKIGNQNIAHRVIERIQHKNTVSYRTKGDSNNMVDPKLVQIDQILGIYTFHIKYIGFPSVWLYDKFNKCGNIAKEVKQ